MNTFALETLGCKVNQYESQQIRELLERLDLNQAGTGQSADLVVVNTCCVTHIASAKSRQYIRKIQKHSPKATVVVAGCLPAGQTSELKDINNDGKIHIISQKNELARALSNLINNSDYNKTLLPRKIKDKTHLPCENNPDEFTILHSYANQSRAFLKIQDGCDGYCSYCIVPKIRSRIINKPIKDVLHEAYNLSYAGHAEIVLTGIFLGAYGQNTVRRQKWQHNKKDCLADLLARIARIDGLKRIRLSSLEPADVTDKLLDTFVKYDNIMPHLHLPLQSGSPRILRKMARQYTIDDFTNIIEKVRKTLDSPAITTDIIVGFPGETDDDFQKTIDFAEICRFSKIHVFSYSQRPGTAAAKMPNKIEPEVIKQRSLQLRQLDQKLQHQFRARFVGKEVRIVVEDLNPVRGRTERYFLAEFPEIKPDSIKKGDSLTAVYKH